MALKAKVSRGTSEMLEATIRRNANLFTGFLVALILVVGVALANGNEGWWVSGLAILVFFLVIFVFVNARVLIKATLATLLTMALANWGLQLGYVMEPNTIFNLVWMTSTLFLYCSLLSLSYLSLGYRSRWTAVALAVTVQFIAIVSLVGEGSTRVGLIAGLLLGVAVFLLYFKGFAPGKNKGKNMPEPFFDPVFEANLYSMAEADGWELRRLEKKGRGEGSSAVDFLAWNEERAYLLVPVKLAGKLGISPSKKGVRLVHQGRSINPWLLSIINGRVPSWRSRNADIMVVLLDMASTNGLKAEVIGVASPDSNRRIPVGIYPAKGLNRDNPRKRGFLDAIAKEYGRYGSSLSAKQREAMGDIGLATESTYLTSGSSDEPDVESAPRA